MLNKASDFPVPCQDVTNRTPPGREMILSFPARESLVSDIPSGDGKIGNLFFHCVVKIVYDGSVRKWNI
jgi:hypothetical protein